MKAPPALVPIRLRDLRLAEEFRTACSGHLGIVADWGHVVDVDERTGRRTRVRAIKVRYGTVERIHSPEFVVLVPFDRPHARQSKDDDRWGAPLEGPAGAAREPFNVPRIAC